MRFLSPSVSFLLATVMVVSPLPAQSPADGAAPAVSGAELQLRVVDSDGLSAPVASKAKKGITIEVTDENGAPVVGAAVTFRLPDNGPTGKFEDGSAAAVAYTDAAGRAHAGNVSWSSAPGVADIRITAAKGTSHTGILFEETLTPPAQAAQSIRAQPEISEQPKPRQIAQLKMPVPSAASADGALPADSSTAKPPLTPASAAPLDQTPPPVSVTGANHGASTSHSKAKWIVIAAIAIGAGAGVALAGKGKSSSSTPQTAQLSIGTPSISVGHP
jgi:hypothetical protein